MLHQASFGQSDSFWINQLHAFGKIICIWTKSVLFTQSGSFLDKMVAFGQNKLHLDKVVVLG